MSGELEAARRSAAETTGLLASLPDERLAPHLVALTWFGWTETHLGHLPDALTHLVRFADVARATGQHHVLPMIDIGRVFALLWSGQVQRATELAALAVDASSFGRMKLAHTSR